MDRRHFVASLLGMGIAAHQLDLDKLLWVPGEKTIFIPSRHPLWMSDEDITRIYIQPYIQAVLSEVLWLDRKQRILRPQWRPLPPYGK